MCPWRRIWVRGRPTTKAKGEISTSRTAKNVSVDLVSPSCPSSHLHIPLSQHSPSQRSVYLGRVRSHFSPNFLTLDLARKQFPGSPWGNLISSFKNANSPPRKSPELYRETFVPTAQQHRFWWPRSTGLIQVTLILWKLSSSRVPYPSHPPDSPQTLTSSFERPSSTSELGDIF